MRGAYHRSIGWMAGFAFASTRWEGNLGEENLVAHTMAARRASYGLITLIS